MKLSSPDRKRMMDDFTALSGFVDPAFKGWTRLSFTDIYADARRWLKEKMEEAGLVTRLDRAANLIGWREGLQPGLPAIMIGSHTDTVKNGGRFDGIVGVLAGIEVVRLLENGGVRLRHPLEVVDFTAEEPTEFGVSTVGSRAMAGHLTPELLESADRSGRSLSRALDELGGDTGDIAGARRSSRDVAAYLELHIEQGPVLEGEKKDLGVVTGIVGFERHILRIGGQPDHAGTTPMDLRSDALAGAAEIVLALESLCRGAGRRNLVGTAGRLEITPNASNVVPGHVDLHAEIRSPDMKLIEHVAGSFLARAARICGRRDLAFSSECVSHTEPVQVDPVMLDVIRSACEQTAGSWMDIVSGAGHDANQVATIAPAGMIFIPSTGGRSHCPEEYTDMEHVLLGTEALLRAVVLLDKRLDP